MSELAAPLPRPVRASARLGVIEDLVARRAQLDHELRVQLNAFASEDVLIGQRDYVSDELALALSESSGTAQRWIENAQLYSAFPAVMARVGTPASQGGWSIRHADALLDTICGLGLSREVQEQVIDLVQGAHDARTPHQLRQAARAAVMVLDPDAAAKRWDKAKRERRVGADQTDPGGNASFWATGTTSQIAMILASIDTLALPKHPGDERSLDQRRFDTLMDLICGRVQPGSWQALVIVSLATLEGGDEPAEIPGLGLISAPEARELLRQAELRRAVVDEHGTLVSVDSTVHRPDLPADTSEEAARQHGCGHTHQTEPEPEAAPEIRPEDQDDPGLEHLISSLTSNLEQQITALLHHHNRTHTPAGHGRAAWDEVRDRRLTVLITLPPHGHEETGGDGPGGAGGGGGSDGGSGPSGGGADPPDLDGHPEPEPPTESDLLWNDHTLDRTEPPDQDPRQHARRPEPDDGTCPAGCPPPPEPHLRDPRDRSSWSSTWSSFWSTTALHRAHARLTTTPVDTRPLDSRSYALPARLSRFIKTRDLTCTFPACRRLARDCQSDHLVPWPQGPSTARNTSSECTHHHQAKHHYFTVTREQDGSLRWTTPLDRSYLRRPRPLLRGW